MEIERDTTSSCACLGRTSIQGGDPDPSKLKPAASGDWGGRDRRPLNAEFPSPDSSVRLCRIRQRHNIVPENTERRRLALRRRVLPAGGGPCAAANGSPRPATLRGRTTPRVAPDLAPKARAWRRGDGALSSASNQSDYKARPSRILIGYSARTDFSNNQSDAAKGWRFELRREGSAAVYRVEGGWRCKRLFFMEFDPKIQKRMRRSSKRFNACLNRILEEVSYGTGVAAGSGRRPDVGGEAGTESSRAFCAGSSTPVPWQERAGKSQVPG
ncbi:hypothetical protein EK904_008849 [Melospiza melodia maxima]|nr:hypothetical protein EK904_008849 [Melospiza melodia maxima]